MPGYPKKKSGLLMGTWLVDRVNLFFRLRRYIKWVQERWYILAASIAVAVGISAYRAINMPDIYRAVSKIGVAPRIQTPYKTQAEYQEELGTFYEKQIDYMNSDHVQTRVKDQLRDSVPKKEGFFSTPSVYKGPVSIVMQVDSTDLNFARQYATLWAREFIAYKSQLRESALDKNAGEVSNEIKRRQDALDAAREALREFESKNKIGSIAEAGAAAQARLDKLLGERQDIKIKRQQEQNRKPEEIAEGATVPTVVQNRDGATNGMASQGIVSSDPLAVVESAKYGDLKMKLRGFEAELELRSATLLPGHPYMKVLAKELASTKQQIRLFLEQIEDRRLATIQELQRDEDGLTPIIEEARQEVLAKSSIQYQFEQLRENEANIKQTLETLQKQAQAIASTPMEDGFFSVDVEGVGDPAPVSPNRPRMVMGGLLFGTVIGLGLIYLLGRLDDRLELAEDIEAELEERIIGQIPLINTKTLAEKRILVSNLDKHNMFAESLRGVRSSIMFTEGGEAPAKPTECQVLIVSSAAPGDGKTTITTNLAVTLAFAGHRVLLIDGDLRRGNIHAYFKWEREQGLAEVLAGKAKWADVARQTPIEALRVISTGALPPNPGELLIGPVTKPLIRELRNNFDYVIFDCPPLTAIDDAYSMARFADGVIFVIMSGQTSMRFAKTALESIRQRGGKILGLVLNGIRPDNPYYYYQQYYYSYYTVEDSPDGDQPVSVVKTTTVRRRRLDPRSKPGKEDLGAESESEASADSKK